MYVSILFYFFFFKQKTAYEMRISDWSSDVCSSDLYPDRHIPGRVSHGHLRNGSPCPRHFLGRVDSICEARTASRRGSGCRSEEHTSELQSLMRISYAVFCLKKKKTNNRKYQLQYSETITQANREQYLIRTKYTR